MLCPACSNSRLVMSERAGIEIDYCPECRGVWLDRGELDKIIERSSVAEPARAAPANPLRHPVPAPGHDPYRRKRKEGFLSDLFDFD